MSFEKEVDSSPDSGRRTRGSRRRRMFQKGMDEVSWPGWGWCDSWVVEEEWIQAKRWSRKEKY
jgi:hypothetical protein